MVAGSAFKLETSTFFSAAILAAWKEVWQDFGWKFDHILFRDCFSQLQFTVLLNFLFLFVRNTVKQCV